MNTPDVNKRTWAEPFKIKMVELLRMTTREERIRRFGKLDTTHS